MGDTNLETKPNVPEDINLNFDAAVNTLNLAIEKVKRENNIALLKDFLINNHGTDIHKITMHIDAEIEEIADADENAQKVIRDLENGRKLHNRIFIWYMEGHEEPEVIMNRYSEYCKEQVAFRTMYISRGLSRPVKVVLKPENTVFPITNLDGLTTEQQNFIIKNVLAAEIRHEYDIERDSILKLQVYTIGPEKIIVILSMYAFPGIEFGGVRNFLFKVFDGYKVKEGNIPHVNDPSIERMNKTIKKKALAYYADLAVSYPPPPRYPGMNLEQAGRTRDSSYYSVDAKVSEALMECAEKADVEQSVIILKAWGEILNQFNNITACSMGMVCKGESLNVVPVGYKEGISLEEMSDQIKESVVNTVVSLDEIAEYIRGNISKHPVRCVHNFLDYNVINEAMNYKKNGELAINSFGDLERLNPALNINYYFFEKKLGINYIYKQNLFVEADINKLHEMLVDSIKKVIASVKSGKKVRKLKKNEGFDVDADKDTARVLSEKRVYARAQAFQDSGIFVDVPIGNIMELARKANTVRLSYSDLVLQEGTASKGIYFIMEGQVAHKKCDSAGRMFTGRVMERGAVVGLESIIYDTRAMATVQVVSDYVTCAYISPIDFMEFAGLYPSIYRGALQRVVNYTDSLFNVIVEITNKANAREQIILKRRELEKKSVESDNKKESKKTAKKADKKDE